MTTTPVPTTLEIVQVDPVAPAMDAVVDVLNQAARRLARKHIVQWPGDFREDGERRVKALYARAEAGQVFLVRHPTSGEPLGTLTVAPDPDPDFAEGWPEGQGIHVSRMARADAAKGLDLGTHMLDLAAHRARFHRYPWLRLDCSRTNTALHRYYKNQGFELVNVVEVPGRKSGALFQREV